MKKCFDFSGCMSTCLTRKAVVITAICIVSICHMDMVNAADITWIPAFSGASDKISAANGVSADGSVVVGRADIDVQGIFHAFRWTREGGIQDLGVLPGGTGSYATAVSADGSVVVGIANTNPDFATHAFRWTQGGGMQDLGVLPGGTRSNAWAVNADGSVIVGQSNNSSNKDHAVLWQVSGGVIQDLGTLPGGMYSNAYGVSADGYVIVGWSWDISSHNHAVRWISPSNLLDLGTLPGGNNLSVAKAVSSDGSVVVGTAGNSSGQNHAVRWTSPPNLLDLGILPGGTQSHASAVSSDGSVVVGGGDITGGYARTFRWTESGGKQLVEDWIVANGGSPLPYNSHLLDAAGVSFDGNIIVGHGTNQGRGHAFIARVVPLGHEVKKIGTDTTYFSSIADAYAEAANDDVIESQAMTFSGDLYFNSDVQIEVSGGYNSVFSLQTGFTTIKGIMTIGAGRVTVDKIIIKSPD